MGDTRKPRTNPNRPGDSKERCNVNTRPNTNSDGSFGIIREPIGPNSHKSFSRDRYYTFGRDKNVTPSLFASLGLHDNPYSTRGQSPLCLQRQRGSFVSEACNQRQNRIYDRDIKADENRDRHRYTDKVSKNDENRGNVERNKNKFHTHKFPLGFKKLEEILNNSSEEVLLKLLENEESFSLLLNQPDLSPNHIYLIIQAIVKVTNTSFEQPKLKIVHIVINDNFVKQLLTFLTQLHLQNERERTRAKYFWDDPSRFFLDVNTFCETVLKVLPTKAVDVLPKLLKGSLLVIPNLNLSDEIYTSYENLNQELLTIIKDLQKKKENKKQRNVIETELEPPENFRALSVFPQPIEIVTPNIPFLRKNVIEGAYKNVYHYLDVQFRLVRNDFIKPLQDSICTYLQEDQKENAQNINIYSKVKFLKSKMSLSGTDCYLIQLLQPKAGFRPIPENSKMFMFGSLVCFTRDNFKNIIFARIVDRKTELLREGRLVISILSNTQKIDLSSNYIMVESKVYFEPYYYVLTALQGIYEHTFPMKEIIVNMKADTAVPNYYKNITYFNISPWEYLIPIQDGVINERLWPTDCQLELNAAQYAAYKNALSSKFAIIQGPPGTGKTRLGLKVAEALLRNAEIWHKGRYPMLVICFTNHALDQFLEGLLATTTELVRIGGQSKSEILEIFNLRYLRDESRKSKEYYHGNLVRTYGFMVHESARELEDLFGLLVATQTHNGIVNVKPLLHELPELKNTIFSNINDRDFIKWLLERTEHVNAKLLENKTDPAANKEEEEERLFFEEMMEIFDTKDEYGIEDDIFDMIFEDIFSVKLVREPYMKTINDYEENLQKLERLRETLESNGDDEDPLEWERLQSEYEQIKLEYNCLKVILEEGKNIVDPQPPKDMALLLKNPYDMLPKDRLLLYLYWVKEYQGKLLKLLSNERAAHEQSKELYEEVKVMANLEILSKKLVIGMTTTSAARLRPLLRSLRSRIVIVEEAAEIMEAHIITALTEHCEHVILIGDHQQLRPSTADFEMETKYHLGISLFERMVRNNVHCNVLEIQHRMRPEISKLITPTIYPTLHDHESVYQFPPVRGVARNLYFIHHTNFESSDNDDSKHNMHEVHYLLHLAQYLLFNGYEPEDITILCAYSAQLFKMSAERKNFAMLSDIRICVLDNYQGEESKIILLSLVRNNGNKSIGFLKIENRICVALSRAREGFYIMGNMDLLTQVSKIWQKINETLQQQDSIGESLPLSCQIHTGKIIPIKTIDDFRKVAEGGCDEICNAFLHCGHMCKSQCHIANRDHSIPSCRERCLKKCEEEHKCPKMCFEECGPCVVPVLRDLECGHQGYYPCFDKIPNCQELVSSKLLCEHETQKMCYLDVKDVKCHYPCNTQLKTCGHTCVQNCHMFNDPNHLKYQCREKCGRIRPNCTMNTDDHRCTKFCSDKCDECNIVCKKVRSCGHAHSLKCSTSIELYKCNKPCKKMLPCGHKCKLTCSELCGICIVKVDKEVPGCGHTIKISCKDTPTKNSCTGNCPLKLPCGHLCQKRCKDTYSIASELSLSKYCKAPCNKKLKCDHNCSGTCGECYQGRIHKACTSNCGVSLICGHVCKTLCKEECPPWRQPCEFRCAHSKCKKKCGEPCTPCLEKCTRQCQHQACQQTCSEICSVEPCKEPCSGTLKCGHNCIGFCGDPCPPLCKVCNYAELMEFVLGYEDEDGAKFVLLEDCKHVIESRGMDMWLNSSSDEINMRCCPRCKQTLANTQRYGDYIKKTLNNVIEVKRKYYGSFPKNLADSKHYMMELQAFYRTTNLKIVCPIVGILYNTFSSQLKPQKYGKFRMLSKLIVESTYVKIQILQNICKMYDSTFKKTDVPPKKCSDYLDFLLERLIAENEHMTQQEIDDYEVELQHLRRILQLSFVSTQISVQITVKKELTGIENKLYCSGPYNVKYDEEIKGEINKLSRAIKKININESELKGIVNIVGVKSGAWYKCPNGHLCAIGDCDGAIGESQCTDCGAPIRRRNH